MKATIERLLFWSVRLSAIFLPWLVLGGLITGGAWSFLGLSVIFGYYFGVEAILWLTGLGIDSHKEDEFRYVHPKTRAWVDHGGLVFYAVSQLIVVPVGLLLLSRDTASATYLIGGVLSLAVMCGSVGGLSGHEFIHAKKPWRRLLGAAVYGSVFYAHFTVSHLRGHHRQVGLADDWSTSRRDETSFAFLWRALVHGFRGAWRLEAARLNRHKKSPLSLSNFVVRAILVQVALELALFAAGGWRAIACHVVVALIAVSLMEIVNYLSHYGLTRQLGPDGRPEAVTARHSWESANKVTNWFIFNAGKHSHHHRRPDAQHHELALVGDEVQLPYGLPLMTIIAFCPPLYFAVMNPRLELRLAKGHVSQNDEYSLKSS